MTSKYICFLKHPQVITAYMECIKSNEHLLKRDGKVCLETTFGSTKFKDLGMKKREKVIINSTLINRAREFLQYDMVR